MLLYEGGGRLPTEPSSFRFISLIDTTAKLYKRMILGRLEEVLNRSGGISIRQHGLRKGSGTKEVIKRIVEFAEKVKVTRIEDRITSVMITFDVQNAFNSAAWDAIDEALRERRVNKHIIRIMRPYMIEREIIIPTDQGTESLTVCAGVPQGSVLELYL